MKLLDYLIAPAALVGLCLTAWWGMYQSPQQPVNLQDQLEQRANAALVRDGHSWARANFDGQRAILTGQAPSEDDVRLAAESVLTSSGPGGLLWGGVTIVESQVDAAAPVSPFVWTATKTSDGEVIFTGHVPSKSLKDRLAKEAGAMPGVSSVDDRTALGRGAPDGNWQGVARFGLEQLSALNTGEARLSERTLRLRGISMDDSVKARVSAEVANITAPFRGEPMIRSPSLWSATHGDGELVLEGQVGTEDERQQILNIAQQFYAGTVRDAMSVGGERHNGWIDGVRTGLPHFSKFKSGEMGFSPPDKGFSFEGEASGSTLKFLAQDMANLTGPYAETVVFAEPVEVDVEEISGIDFGADPVAACQQAFDSVMATNSVQFESGSAVISRESGQTLDKLMAVSGRCASSLVFELGGHTDNAGDRTFNVQLSEQRARAVADYMAASGFDPQRLSAIGYGPDRPVAGNDSPDGRAKNRRLEFTVLERSE